MSTVGDAITLSAVGKAPTLTALLNEFPGHEHKGVLGRLLRDFRGRVLGTKKFVRTDHKIPKWQLVDVPQTAEVILLPSDRSGDEGTEGTDATVATDAVA